jgi:hypothetical protein
VNKRFTAKVQQGGRGDRFIISTGLLFSSNRHQFDWYRTISLQNYRVSAAPPIYLLQRIVQLSEVKAMNRKSSVLVHFIIATGMALVLTACGGGGSSSSGGSGALSLSVADAPVSDADISAVWVRFTSVIVKPASGSSQPIEVPVSDNLGHPYIDIDLKSLSGGKTATLLGEYELPSGHYSWMRLVIDPAYTYVVETGGGESLLDCSSCDESHLKLNRSFTIEQGGVIAFTIDFDLRKSISGKTPISEHRLQQVIDSMVQGDMGGPVHGREHSLVTGRMMYA